MTEGPHDMNGDTFHRRPSDNGTRVKRYIARKVDHTYSKASTTALIWIVGAVVLPFGMWWIQDTLKVNRLAAVKMVESVQEIATEVKVMVSQQEESDENVLKHEVRDINMHSVQWKEINKNRQGISDLRDRTGRLEGIVVGGE